MWYSNKKGLQEQKALYNLSSREVHTMIIYGTLGTFAMLHVDLNQFHSHKMESTSAVEIILKTGM